MKKINKNPTRGDIYECIFGNYVPVDQAFPQGPFRKDLYDVRIPNEMRKRRPVVIVGERKKQFLVVPISSLEDTHPKAHRTGEAVRLHIRLDEDEVPVAPGYIQGTVCWAKTDLVQSVDEERLREFRLDDGTHVVGKVSAEKLLQIQEGIMRVIGLTGWVQKSHDEIAAKAAAELAASQAPV